MSAVKAAEHDWLNRSPENSARRSELRARAMNAMAAKRALRLDAAVFKAGQAADTVRQLEERVLDSSVLELESSVTLSPAATKATEDVLSCLRECDQRITLMQAQTQKAQTRVKRLEMLIAEGKPGAPSGVQPGGRGEVRFIGSYAEHTADQSLWKAEMCAGEAEDRSTAAAAAVETWEKIVAEAVEEAAEAVEAAKVAEALEATLRTRKSVRVKKAARTRRGKADTER